MNEAEKRRLGDANLDPHCRRSCSATSETKCSAFDSAHICEFSTNNKLNALSSIALKQNGRLERAVGWEEFESRDTEVI